MHRFLVCLILAPAFSVPAAAADPVSFRREVIPALTAAGCNAGACHGSPTGKNGFRLSLRGYDPDAGWASLTKEFEGRRIDRLDPANSLFLLKATGRTAHEGGTRIRPEGELFRLLREWVAKGAMDDHIARPTRITVAPPF